jgi:hypothetical protein
MWNNRIQDSGVRIGRNRRQESGVGRWKSVEEAGFSIRDSGVSMRKKQDSGFRSQDVEGTGFRNQGVFDSQDRCCSAEL